MAGECGVDPAAEFFKIADARPERRHKKSCRGCAEDVQAAISDVCKWVEADPQRFRGYTFMDLFEYVRGVTDYGASHNALRGCLRSHHQDKAEILRVLWRS